MYVFAPLVLIPLAMSVKAGVLAVLVVLGLSTAANVVTVVHYYFPFRQRMRRFPDYHRTRG